jgi:hypothetical protein
MEKTTTEKSDPKFWGNDPNILLSQTYILEFFPTETMTFNQKLNAITRLIIILTVVSFAITKKIRLVVIAALLFGAIYLMHYVKTRDTSSAATATAEGFENPADKLTKKKQEFLAPSPQNPMGNVLMTDYEDDPNKKPAPPLDNEEVSEQILEKTREFIVKNNSSQPDIKDKLFSDLGDNFDFEMSMRPFYSTASTEIPNDQTAFAEFCYGGMVSCKEGNAFACARNLQIHVMI